MNNEEISIEALRKELESGLDDFIDSPEQDRPDPEYRETPGKKVAPIRPEKAETEPSGQDIVLEMDRDTELLAEKLDRAIRLLEKNFKWSEKMANMIQKQTIAQQSKAKTLSEGQDTLTKKVDRVKLWILGTGLGLAFLLWIMLQMAD